MWRDLTLNLQSLPLILNIDASWQRRDIYNTFVYYKCILSMHTVSRRMWNFLISFLRYFADFERNFEWSFEYNFQFRFQRVSIFSHTKLCIGSTHFIFTRTQEINISEKLCIFSSRMIRLPPLCSLLWYMYMQLRRDGKCSN